VKGRGESCDKRWVFHFKSSLLYPRIPRQVYRSAGTNEPPTTEKQGENGGREDNPGVCATKRYSNGSFFGKKNKKKNKNKNTDGSV
jgi:hypothetical protein